MPKQFLNDSRWEHPSAQDGPKSLQDCSKTAQKTPEMTQEASKAASKQCKRALDGPGPHQKEPQASPRGPSEESKTA
eukprot:3968586-Pyramimonas_sp.AAC.1